MNEIYVYVIFSQSLQKYYIGVTADVAKRFEEHNRGKGNYTAKGFPWQIVVIFNCKSRSEAMQLETKIKKRGAKRFLCDNNIHPM